MELLEASGFSVPMKCPATSEKALGSSTQTRAPGKGGLLLAAPGVQRPSWKTDATQHLQMGTSDVPSLVGLGLWDAQNSSSSDTKHLEAAWRSPGEWLFARPNLGVSTSSKETGWRWPLSPGLILAENRLVQMHLPPPAS